MAIIQRVDAFGSTAETYAAIVTQPHQLRFEHGAWGERFAPNDPGANSRDANPSGGGEKQTAQNPIGLELIWFSKIHYITVKDFNENGAKYHNILQREAALLKDSLEWNKVVYREWAEPGGWDQVFASASQQLGKWLSDVKGAHKPPKDAFDKLINRAAECIDRLKALSGAQVTHRALWEEGVELARIRADEAALAKQVNAFRESSIEGAVIGKDGAEFVEGLSFGILNLVPTITLMDPLREAAYRISLIMLRCGGRGLGAAAAGVSVTHELFGVLKADVPPLVADMLLKPLGRSLTKQGVGDKAREFTIWLMRQNIEFFSDVFVLISEKKKITEEDMRGLMINRLASTLAQFLGCTGLGPPGETARANFAKALIESTANTLFRDYLDAMNIAKAENRETFEVFLGMLPSSIMKIAQGTILGAMTRHAGKMSAAAEKAAIQPSASRDDIKILLGAQKWSSVFTGDIADPHSAKGATIPRHPRPDVRMGAQAWEKHLAEGYKATFLHPKSLGPLIRHAWNARQIITFRIPNKLMAAHMDDPGKRPKPLPIKGKSAKSGEHAGLVTKPTPHTHGADYDAAMKTWKKGHKDMLRAGNMVRKDGLVFHPDMLADIAKTVPPADAVVLNRAKAALEKARAAGHADFTEPASQDWAKSNLTSQELADVNHAMSAKVKVGYFSDVDLTEVIDEVTGDRKIMGSGLENKMKEAGDKRALNYVQDNQEALDAQINARHGNRLGDAAHPHNLVQHGGDFEYHDPAGGHIAVVTPEGKVFIIGPEFDKVEPKAVREAKIREAYEAKLKDILGTRYIPKENRGMTLLRPWEESDRVLELRHGYGQYRSENEIKRINQWPSRRADWFSTKQNDAAEYAHGTPDALQNLDVGAGWMHRFLSPNQFVVAEALGMEFAAFDRIADRYGVVLAVNGPGKQFVVGLIVGKHRTISQGVLNLAGAAHELGLHKKPQNLFFEMYPQMRPRTTTNVLDRLGPVQPLFPVDQNGATKQQSGCTLYAYSVGSLGFRNNEPVVISTPLCAAPTPRNEGDSPLGAVAPGALILKEHAPYRAPKLMAVWEKTSTRKLQDPIPFTIFDREVAVCFSTVASAVQSEAPKKLLFSMSGLTKKPSAEAMA